MKGKLFSAGRIALGLAASGGLGWLAARGLDWGVVRDSFEGVSLSLVLLAVAFFMLASLVRAYRWQILFVNQKISILRLFIIQNEGIGLNNVMPVRVASEPMQLAVLTLRDRINGATALATLGMERVIDVVASTLILGVAFFLVPEMQNFALYVWGAIGFTVVVVALVRFLAWGSDGLAFIRRVPFAMVLLRLFTLVMGLGSRLFSPLLPAALVMGLWQTHYARLISFLAAFATAVRDLERERARLLASLLMSVLYWLMVGITAWIIAVAIDLPVSPMTATLVIMGTIFFATAVPAAPSALGTFEFAGIYVLAFFGVEREAGFGFAVITHAVFFLPPTIIAAIFLPREGVLSLRRMRGLAARGAGAGHGSGS